MKKACKIKKLTTNVCRALLTPFLSVINPITEPLIKNAKGCKRNDKSELRVIAVIA